MKKRFGLAAVILALGAMGCSQTDDDSSPVKAAEQLGRAWQTFRLTEYKTAVSQFEAVSKAARPGDDEQLEALYGLGCVWWLRQEGRRLDRAGEYFEETIALAPGSDMAGWSRLALARMQHLVSVGDKVDYPAARSAYQEVIDACPEHPAAAEAFLYQQATHLLDGGEQGASTALKNVRGRLAAAPDALFAGALHRLASECCEALGDPDGQLDELLRSRRESIRDPNAPDVDASNAYWELATVAEFEAGRLDVAREYYQRLLDEYPTDMRSFSADRALDRIADVERRLSAEREMPEQPE